MTKILFVINPVSGGNDKNDFIQEAKDSFDTANYRLQFFETRGKNDLPNLLKKILKDKPDVVVAVGGDGTVNLVARAVMNKKIKMAIIPYGSANGMARELNLPESLSGAFDVIEGGGTRKVDIVRINKKNYSIHLSDIGFNARIVEKFEENPRRGLITYARFFLHEILNPQTYRFVIHHEGKRLIRKALMIVIANASRFGTGAMINPGGKPDDGIVEIVLVKPYHFWHFIRMIIPFYTGKIQSLDFVEIYRGDEFVIENPERQSIQVDGELAGNSEKVSVEVLKNVVQVLVYSEVNKNG